MRVHCAAALQLARDWFDQRTVEVFFEPLVADWQHERLYAQTPRDRLRADLRGWLALVSTVIRCIPRLVLAPTAGVQIPSGTYLWWFFELGILVQLLAFVAIWQTADIPIRVLWQSAAWLLPSCAVLAMILLLVPVAQRLHAPATQPIRVALLQLTVLATIGVASASQWLVPAANQRFRIEAARAMGTAEPARGARELSISDLFGRHAAQRYAIDPDAVRVERHARIALLSLPAVLAWYGWRRRRCWSTSTRLTAAGVAWAAPLLLIQAIYWTAVTADWAVGTHIMAVWMPIAVLTATGLPLVRQP